MRSRSWKLGLGVVLGVVLVWPFASLAHPEEPEEPAPPPSPWDVRVALGGSLRGGDVSRFGASGDAEVSYKWTQDTVTARILADYAETTNEVTNPTTGFLQDVKIIDTQNYGGSLRWRHDFTERWFSQARTTADSDPIQSRDVRVTVDFSPGCRVWMEDDAQFLDLMAGVGYRFERFNNGQPDNQFMDVRAAYNYLDKIGPAVEIAHQTEILAPVNEIEAYLLRSELTLSVPLVMGFYFRTNGRLEYQGRPAVGRKDLNYWLTFGLEYRFGS